MQPGRSHDYRLYRRVDGTHIGQPSTNIDLERQTANGARHSGRDQGNRPGCSRVRPGGPNATVEASGKQRTGATAVDMKLKVVAVPVSDVDRAKDGYQSLGWLLDADFLTGPDFRVIQMNPGLGSRSFSARGSPQTRPGSAQGLTTSLPCRATSAGGIRLPDWPGGGAAPRAAVAHGKHEEETAISSAQRRPSGAWSRRRRRRARRAHHYRYRARESHPRHRRRPTAHSDS